MGEGLLALGLSGLVAAVAGAVSGWVAAGYTGVLCAVVVMVLCLGQFVRRRWPGLLFWFGAALGAAVAQALVLLTGTGADDLGPALATYGAIGAIFGMLPGGMAADVWQDRRSREAEESVDADDDLADRAPAEGLQGVLDPLKRKHLLNGQPGRAAGMVRRDPLQRLEGRVGVNR
jgi:hypothetical protein